jgi:type IV secretion system protein VirD4
VSEVRRWLRDRLARVPSGWRRGLLVSTVALAVANAVWNIWGVVSHQSRAAMRAGWLEVVGDKNNTVPSFVLACALNERCRPVLYQRSRLETDWRYPASGVAALALLPIVWVLLGPRRRMLYDARWASLARLNRMIFDDAAPPLGQAIQVARAWAHYPALQKNRHGYLQLPAWGDRPGPRGGKVIALATSSGRRELSHVLVCGPNRSGKGLLITHNLLTWAGNAIVNDPKGENHRLTAGYRASLGHRILVLDPRGFGQRFDPFSVLGASPDLLRSAAEAIVQSELEREPIFAQRASAGVYAALRAATLKHEAVLPYLRRVTRDSLEGFVAALRDFDDAEVRQGIVDLLQDAQGRALDPHDRFLASAWGTFVAKLQPLFSEGVLSTSGGSDFTLNDFLHEPTTLYLRFSETSLGYASAYLRLVWLALSSGLIDASDALGEPLPIRTLLVLDEARAVPMPKLGTYASTMAGRGMAAMVVIQALRQLDAVYGEHEAREILANCTTQLFFRTPDLETQRFISERCGWTTVADREVLRSKQGHVTTYRAQKRELIAPDEVDRLHSENVIVFAPDVPPILARRLECYREHPAWRDAKGFKPPEVRPIPAGPADANVPRDDAQAAPEASGGGLPLRHARKRLVGQVPLLEVPGASEQALRARARRPATPTDGGEDRRTDVPPSGTGERSP